MPLPKPKSEATVRLLLTLIIPGFLALLVWASPSGETSKPPTPNHPSNTPDDQQTITFADTSPVPGPGVWQQTASGLKYLDLTVGQGPVPQIGQRIAFLYAIHLENGRLIVSNRIDQQSYQLAPLNYIYGYAALPSGWTEAVSTMKVGGWRRFILPPSLAYGASTLGGKIPPDSTLVIDAQLILLDPAILPNDTLHED